MNPMTTKRGAIKVMVDSKGTPKIQETTSTGDSENVRVYTLPEWNKELEKRTKAAAKKARTTTADDKNETVTTDPEKTTEDEVETTDVDDGEKAPGDDGLIQEDTDND